LLLRVRASRFAAAEELINLAALDQRNDGTALRILIVPTYLLEGRLDDALDLIEARLQHSQQEGEGASHTAIVLARLHFDLEHPSNSVDTTRADLERAGRHTPDDDRIWLGRANLAIRSGNFEEAARWLNDCERLRPGDLPVWKARLRLAMAAGQVARVMEALRHLPASTTKEAEVHRIRAWLARHQGDPAVEQQELTLALAAAPADRRALERLSEIAKAAGQTEQLAQLQNHNAEIERMTARYKKLLERNQPIRDSIELGLLAEKLGRPFEARVYLGVAATEGFHRDQASRNLDRLEHQMADLRRATGSLAEIVGAGAGSAQPGQSTARPRNE
jgi:tetratricopeptide (TPR) repeat protein